MCFLEQWRTPRTCAGYAIFFSKELAGGGLHRVGVRGVEVREQHALDLLHRLVDLGGLGLVLRSERLFGVAHANEGDGGGVEADVLRFTVGRLGTEATSPLIAYIDTATGLPITPNGGDIIVTWDNGTNKIFRV